MPLIFVGTMRKIKQLSILLSLLLASPIFAFVPAQKCTLFVPVKSTRPFAAPLQWVKHEVSSTLCRDHRHTQLKAASSIDDFDAQMMKTENELLRQTVRQLEKENERLREGSSRIILETFEGEGQQRAMETSWYDSSSDGMVDTDGITMSGAELEAGAPLWCDELDGDTCPLEPTISFLDALRDRAYWLVGLLALQSCSGFILSRNEALLENHPVIIFFLTMLVGAGGNAGNQASVRGKPIPVVLAVTRLFVIVSDGTLTQHYFSFPPIHSDSRTGIRNTE